MVAGLLILPKGDSVSPLLVAFPKVYVWANHVVCVEVCFGTVVLHSPYCFNSRLRIRTPDVTRDGFTLPGHDYRRVPLRLDGDQTAER